MARPARRQALTAKYRNLEGIDDLLSKLGTMADLQMRGNQLRYDIRGVLHQAQMPIRDAAIAFAPDRPSDIKRALVSAFGKDTGKDPSTVVMALFAKSPWWHWWEFGTSGRTTKQGAFRGAIQPVRFLRRGATSARPQVASRVASGLRAIMKDYEL